MEQTKSSAQQDMEALDAEYARLTAEDHALSIQERDLLLAEQKFLRQELRSIRADYKRWKDRLKERIQESISINLVRDKTLQDLRTQGDLDRKEKDALRVELSDVRQVLSYAAKEKDACKVELSKVHSKLGIAMKDKDALNFKLFEMRQKLFDTAKEKAASEVELSKMCQRLFDAAKENDASEVELSNMRQRLEIMVEKDALEVELSNMRQRLEFAVEDKRIAEQGLEKRMQQASHSAARTPQAGIAHAPLSNASGSDFKFENSIHRSKRRLSTTSETPPLGKLEVSHKDKRLKREPSPKPGSRIVNPYSPHKPHGDYYRPREPSSHQSLRRTPVSRPQDEKESPKLQ